jgi:hypothetical protein
MTSLEMFSEFLVPEPSTIFPSHPTMAVERKDTMDRVLAPFVSQANDDVSDGNPISPEDLCIQIEHDLLRHESSVSGHTSPRQAPEIRTKGGYSPEEYLVMMNEPVAHLEK